MSQRIRCVQDPAERTGVARVLGCDADALASGICLLWTVDQRVAGAAHVDAGAVARFAVHAPEVVGGSIALARMAVATAAHLGSRQVAIGPELLAHAPAVAALRLAPTVRVDESSRALDLPRTARSAWERQIFDRGEIITRLGAPADTLRVIARGSVRLVGVDHRNSPREIGQIGPGEILSEAVLHGVDAEPLHVMAHAAEVDLMVVPRAVVEAERYTAPWARWIQKALARRIATLNGRLLNGAEPQLIAHAAEILADLARGPAAGRCSLKWLAEQVGVHAQRARVLIEPLWEAVTIRGDEVRVLDAQALLGAVGARPPQRRELLLSQPTL